MPSVADDRAGKTIYADDVKIIKGKIRQTATSSAQKASLQLINRDRTDLYHRLDQMVSDDIVTPLEKRALQLEWNQVESERNNITMKAMEYGITEQEVYRNYLEAFTSISSSIAIVLDPLHINENTNISEIGDIRSNFAQYHQKLALLSEQLFRYETGLLDGLDSRVKMEIRITSSLGTVLPLDGTLSTLSVKVLRDGIDVTPEFDDTCFHWKRLSEDVEGDVQWNAINTMPTKILGVSVADLVHRSAIFICEFEYFYSDTMKLAKSGFIMLNEEAPGPPGEDVYQVQVLCSQGTVFRQGQDFNAQLVARVWQGTQEITDSFVDTDFRWSRSSEDTQGDEVWNSSHYSTGGKTLQITHNDVAGKSVFNCDLLRERSA